VNDKLQVLDLFAGIGGFSLGLERTGGFETTAFCEIKDYPRRVLAKHWPDVPIYKDVRELTGDAVGTPDVICGGPPCQPFSRAGERRGAEDDRFLWPEMARLVEATKPDWVITENVVDLISLGLDDILSDLDRAGYTSATFVIPAVGVDARHRRDRLFIVSNAGGQRLPLPQQSPPQRAPTWRAEVGPATPEFLEWPSEPNVARVAYGVPNRVDRIKALGNSIIPRIATIIGHAILEANIG
jgi:DNA (cytosine-5)-methyltransferase 1